MFKFLVYFSGWGFFNDTYSCQGAEILELMSCIRIFMMNEVAGDAPYTFWPESGTKAPLDISKITSCFRFHLLGEFVGCDWITFQS